MSQSKFRFKIYGNGSTREQDFQYKISNNETYHNRWNLPKLA